eukprot:CAMPEP_0172606918 /NCGR_PEP_ID=MMETSP1068-20121228/27126_1 /TAXON_ID=35684 /ORGANISM="Pseudopedinella elastica, Strain CCMP716" /LENGTH=317 /DNA_ID=CAMNT_0013409793 /DNA_START=19 /DNA_END=968 /DNA_ORIENTATION=+
MPPRTAATNARPRKGNGNGAPPNGGPMNAEGGAEMSQRELEVNRERFLVALQDLTGQHVSVELMDGDRFDAVFHTVSATSGTDFNYVFKAARKSSSKPGQPSGGYTTKLVHCSQVLQIIVASIVLKEHQPGGKGFATDAEIGAGSASHLMNRDLLEVDDAWLDGELEAASAMEAPKPGEKWDQFEANFRLTGRMATYDESIYTTSLDKTKLDESKVNEAAKIAAEIEGQAGETIHEAEERGQKVDLKGMDEEDLYSGVLRDTGKKTEGAKKTSSLRAEAKEFVFNPGAKEFVPSFGSAVTPAAAAQPPAAGPGQGGG